MKYTFFDVETANFNQSSICSIGYIVLKDGEITDSEYYLVKPEPFYMDWYNTQIHGITEEMVKNEPTFDIIWNKIKCHFNNTTLIAHFSQFDMKCLRDVLNVYNLEYPNAEYSCTYALARRGITGLCNYKLDTLAEYYNIQFNHHNALEDAKACYEVLMNVLKDNNTSSIEELHSILKIEKGWIKNTGEWKSFESANLNGKTSKIDISKIKTTVENIDEDNEFYGKNIVFTGTLERMTRKDAMQIIVNSGGIPDDKVNKNTDYLIIGKSDFIDFKNGKKTNKLKKAEELIKSGQELEIIDETDFYRMIGEASKVV